MKRLFLFIAILLWTTPLSAKERASLTPPQVERVNASQRILQDVEKRPLPKIVSDLEKSNYPEGSLQILDAIAATYE